MGQAGRGLKEVFARDVDGDIGGRTLQGCQEQAYLDAGARAEFDQACLGPNQCGDVCGMVPE
jgi:hypothetical protein